MSENIFIYDVGFERKKDDFTTCELEYREIIMPTKQITTNCGCTVWVQELVNNNYFPYFVIHSGIYSKHVKIANLPEGAKFKIRNIYDDYTYIYVKHNNTIGKYPLAVDKDLNFQIEFKLKKVENVRG